MIYHIVLVTQGRVHLIHSRRSSSSHQSTPLASICLPTNWRSDACALKSSKSSSDANELWNSDPASARHSSVSVTRYCAADCSTATRAIPYKIVPCLHKGHIHRCCSRIGGPPSRSRRDAHTAPRAFCHLARQRLRPIRRSGRSRMYIPQIVNVPRVLLHATRSHHFPRIYARKCGKSRKVDGCDG